MLGRRKVRARRADGAARRAAQAELQTSLDGLAAEAEAAGGLARLQAQLGALREAKSVWQTFNKEAEERKKALEASQREKRSELLKKQTAFLKNKRRSSSILALNGLLPLDGDGGGGDDGNAFVASGGAAASVEARLSIGGFANRRMSVVL